MKERSALQVTSREKKNCTVFTVQSIPRSKTRLLVQKNLTDFKKDSLQLASNWTSKKQNEKKAYINQVRETSLVKIKDLTRTW